MEEERVFVVEAALLAQSCLLNEGQCNLNLREWRQTATATYCYLLLSTAADCSLLRPTAGCCYLLLPTAVYCCQLLSTASYRWLLLAAAGCTH